MNVFAMALILLAGMAKGAPWPGSPDLRAGGNWISVVWSATGDGHAKENVDAYRYYIVRRSDDGGNVYSVAGTVFTESSAAGGSRAFWDRELTVGTVYTYEVVAIAPGGGTHYSESLDNCRNDPLSCYAAGESTSVYSGTASLMATAGSSPFGGALVRVGNQWVAVDWSDNEPEAGVDSYSVYQTLDPGGPTWLRTATPAAVLSTVDSHVFTGLVNLTQYYFMVFPCCPDRSPAFVRATPYLPAAGTGIPEGRTDSSAGPRAVRLTWAPAIPGSYGLVAYAIFRSDDGGSTFVEVGRPAASVNTFVDSVPMYGLRYFYVIRPVDSMGNLGDAYRIVLIDVILPTNRLFLNRNTMRPGKGESLDIAFQITESGRVRISIFTLTGELVREIYDLHLYGNYNPDVPYNSLDAGLPSVDTMWNGANDSGELVTSGAYLVVLEINDARDVRSIAVVR